MPKKLSPRQQYVLDQLKAGWELRETPCADVRYNLCRGNTREGVNPKTIDTLHQNGLIASERQNIALLIWRVTP